MGPGDLLGFQDEAPATPAARWADVQAPYSELTPYAATPSPMLQGLPNSGRPPAYGPADAENAGAGWVGRCAPPQPQAPSTNPGQALHANVAAEYPNIARPWLSGASQAPYCMPQGAHGNLPMQHAATSGSCLPLHVSAMEL